jgi:phenylalanyl-tRNA synthetase beta chain
MLNKKMDVAGKINIFEIFSDNLPLQKKSGSKKAFIVSDLQVVKRDFAFILDEKISISDLIKLVENQEKDLISAINIFDIYRGNKIDQGKKSVAFGVEIQPKIKTLTSDEIDQISNKIIAAVSSNLNGVIRDGSN